MRAIIKILAGGAAMAALAGAAPAAAQYYPGYGYGGGYGNGGVIGSIINGVTGGYGGYGGYGYNGYGYGGGANSQVAANQCASAVQQRLSGGGYGGYGGYGYNGYAGGGGGRVLGISRIEPRSNGGLTVHGVANSGRYGYSYGGQQQIDLTWKCRTDIRGLITGIEVDVARPAYGSNYNNNYTPWGNYDYSQY